MTAVFELGPALRGSVRRVASAEEIDHIRDAQRSDFAPYLLKYSDHAKWVDAALKDVEDGSRVAFATYVTSGGAEHYVGSLILKRSEYAENKVEMKNFIFHLENISRAVRYQHELATEGEVPDQVVDEQVEQLVQSYREDLLGRAVRFCESRGFGRIDTELPLDEKQLLPFLARHGFHISNLAASRYRAGDFFYTLTLELNRSYSGDPFHFRGMVGWILAQYHPHLLVADDDLPRSGNHSSKKVTLRPATPLGDSVSARSAVPDLEIRGKSVVFDSLPETSDFRGLSFADEDRIRFVFSEYDDDRLRSWCEANRADYFPRSELLRLSGRRSLAQRIGFSRDRIGGMIVDLGEPYHDTLMELAESRIGFTYFVWSGIGRYAADTPDRADDAGGDLESDNVLLVCGRSGSQQSTQVVAYARIESAYPQLPEEIWREGIDGGRLIGKQEFLFHTRYRPDRNLACVECAEPRVLAEPLSLQDLLGPAARQLYLGEDQDSGFVDCYIDRDVRAAFVAKLETTSRMSAVELRRRRGAAKPMVFVSYSHRDEEQARDLVARLEADGSVAVSVDFRSFEPGAELTAAIRDHVTQADIVVLLVSLESLSSPWVGRELMETLNTMSEKRSRSKLLGVDLTGDLNGPEFPQKVSNALNERRADLHEKLARNARAGNDTLVEQSASRDLERLKEVDVAAVLRELGDHVTLRWDEGIDAICKSCISMAANGRVQE